MRHQDLTLNHRLESWVYANAGARLGASGFVSGDIGRIAYQSDEGSYWRLTSIAPTWAGANIGAKGIYQGPAPPAPDHFTTTSTTPVMCGFPGSITPVSSGRIYVVAAGFLDCLASTPAWVESRLRYGTGIKPVAGAAAVGTVVGNLVQSDNGVRLNWFPFVLTAVIPSLNVGSTPYWLDIDLTVKNGAGTFEAWDVTISAFEI